MIACKGLSSEHLAGQLSSGKEGGSLEKLAIRQLCEEEYLGSLGGELHGWILGMAIRAGGCMALRDAALSAIHQANYHFRAGWQ